MLELGEDNVKLGIEKIENGWIVNKSGTKIYYAELKQAYTHARTYLDEEVKNLENGEEGA